MPSAIFHVVGNVFLIMEQLMISVIGPNMTGMHLLCLDQETYSTEEIK